jgi:hypothetical protein
MIMRLPAKAVFLAFALLLFSCTDKYTSVEEYWELPLKPNGNPPKFYSPLEASLDPKACASCHAQKYDEWADSLHSKTISSGVLWQLKMMDQLSANKCMDCHAPLSEQKALMAMYMNYPSKPDRPIPSYITEDLHLKGLVCAACHVREHKRYGPPPSKSITSSIPHGGFEVKKFFQDSKFCAVCHQFPKDGERTNGKLRQNTYEEWKNSKFYLKGITCQNCHMPNRKHTWKGIHDRDTVLRAVSVEVWIDRDKLNIKLTNTGAGHNLPTYMVPKIFVEAYQGNKEIVRGIVGWMVDEYDLEKEIFDTRIPPGRSLIFTGNVANTKETIELIIRVSPKEHYYRAFSRFLNERGDNLPQDVKELLKDAIKESEKSEYILIRHTLLPKDLVNGKYTLNYGAPF